MMGQYAKTTQVSSDASRTEIERTLARYGATSFMYGWNDGQALIAFEMNGRRLKFELPLPKRDEFSTTPTGRERRSIAAIDKAYEQSVRQKWRALALVIKAKLEAVASQITVFDEEFLAHIVLPTGETVGDFMVPQIEQTYKTGRMPLFLPMLKDGER